MPQNTSTFCNVERENHQPALKCPSSFGQNPKGSARKSWWIVNADIKGYFNEGSVKIFTDLLYYRG